MIRGKIGAVLAGIVMVVGLSAPAMAGPAVPASVSGPYQIQLTGDSLQYVGSDDLNAGTMIIGVSSGRARNLHFNDHTFYFSDDAGEFTLSNGNFMAANNSCSGVTIKSDSTSNGTVWALHDLGAGGFLLINRYCDQQAGTHDNIALGLPLGASNGTQWKTFGPSGCGCWRQVFLHSV
jgi:hypothetical protein